MSAALPIGDPVGFARLVDDHRSMVCSIALSIVRDVSTSEDVAQEVFLAAWQQLEQLRNPASLGPWLRQVTRNRATDRLRRRTTVALTDEPPSPADFEAAALASERHAVLAEVLDGLPDDSREVVLLFYREGRSIRQVARLLDLSDAAVKKRLSRARARIREDVAARFADAVRDTAPTAALTLAVTSALSVGAPSLASASVMGKAGAATANTALGGAVLGPALGVAGIAYGTRRTLEGARDDQERAALRRTGWVASALVVGLGLLAVFIPREPVWMWSWYAMLLGSLGLIYRVWVPRILAPRWAAERAEDPKAEARQRRQTIASWIGLLVGATAGAVAIVFAL
ncbi:MAG: sigma-70 family RNA polymerase sigma factor [Myxococcota bacterium]